MKLNEAIKKYERYYKRYKSFTEFLKHEHNNYQAIISHKLANDYLQLFRWLKDYKRLLKQNKHKGHWMPMSYDSYADGNPVWDEWECSECGYEHHGEDDTLTCFCPDCGADMREGEK